jgi:hypothetical protein
MCGRLLAVRSQRVPREVRKGTHLGLVVYLRRQRRDERMILVDLA